MVKFLHRFSFALALLLALHAAAFVYVNEFVSDNLGGLDLFLRIPPLVLAAPFEPVLDSLGLTWEGWPTIAGYIVVYACYIILFTGLGYFARRRYRARLHVEKN